jgi:hypothetical protein
MDVKLARGLLASGSLALVCACVFTALALYGVISVGAARVLLLCAWIVAVLGTAISEYVWGKKPTTKSAVTLTVAIFLGAGFWQLDAWAMRKRASTSVPSTMTLGAESSPSGSGGQNNGTAASKGAPDAAGNHTPQSASVSEHPDLELRFVYPKDPALIISNPSDKLASEIKWMVILWDMDAPDRKDPLPIPTSGFDWIKPHDETGAQNLFDTNLVTPLLKQGDRLYGSGTVNCPECDRGRTYILYVTFGQGGWYSEIKSEKSGHILVPSDFSEDGREAYFKQLDAMVPAASRTPIGDR